MSEWTPLPKEEWEKLDEAGRRAESARFSAWVVADQTEHLAWARKTRAEMETLGVPPDALAQHDQIITTIENTLAAESARLERRKA